MRSIGKWAARVGRHDETADRGILYIATGPKYIAEAIDSARSVRAVWPEMPLAVFCDAVPEPGVFDHVDIVAAEGSNRDKLMHLGRTPFARTLFLDSDTYCCAPCPELFDLLDRFDIAAAQDNGRFSQARDARTGEPVFVKLGEAPGCFPEFNGGVMVYRRSSAVRAMFERWLAEYDAHRDGEPPVAQDQPTMRAVLYRSKLRLGVFPSEYNFRLNCPGYARNAIKIIHGRWEYAPIAETRPETFRALDRTFNISDGPRVFVPLIGMIFGHGPDFHAPAEPERRRTLVAQDVGDSRSTARRGLLFFRRNK